VLIGEPPRTQFDVNFRLLGIPVRIHPFFWLAALLMGPRQGGPQVVLLWISAFFLGILCHEVGHALVMRGQGQLPWITLYGLGGMASSNRSGIGSGSNQDAWRQIFISVAGPLAGFILAAITLMAAQASGYLVLWIKGLPFGLMAYVVNPNLLSLAQQSLGIRFANDLLFVTIVYGILNLLPVYPLDGGQIAREVLVMLLGREGVRQSLILSMFVSGFLAAAGVLLWSSFLFALFFGFLAFSSYATLMAYTGRGPW
jgi:stage IV sporulation protein FB